MLPYVQIKPISLGPYTFHPFGLLVAIGITVGLWLGMRRARALGYDPKKLRSLAIWMLVVGFLFSHVLDEVFYFPERIAARPWSLLFIWESLSSMGGFIGAIVGGFTWKFVEWDTSRSLPIPRLRAVPMPVLPFTDVTLQVFPVAWIFGRMGCALVHDHPGARTSGDSFLAVAYPGFPGEGRIEHVGPLDIIYGSAPRYDLGLLELLFTIVLAAALALTWRLNLRPGTYAAVVSLSYAPVRFALDFLRKTEGEGSDLRHGSLTFAQWACAALFVFGVAMVGYLIMTRGRRGDSAALVRP